MRSSLVLLASLASVALAYPADVAVERRTPGHLHDVLGDHSSEVVSFLESVLIHGDSSHASTLAGLSAYGAAALEGSALGCHSEIISFSARHELKAWLLSTTLITGSLKAELISWCDGQVEILSTEIISALVVYIPICAEIAAKDSIYVTIDGISSEHEIATSELVLSLSAREQLTAFLEFHHHHHLDVEIEAGLKVCAAGGVVDSLSVEIKSALLVWVNSSECTLEDSLKFSIIAWLEGKEEHECVAIGSISDSALITVSVGASAAAFVEESGSLSVHAQATLSAFIETSIAEHIDERILFALKACAEGELASSLDIDVRTTLVIWLYGSDCTLGVELKAVVLLWLSFCVTAEASIEVVQSSFFQIGAFLTETDLVLLSVQLRGALGLLAAGESSTVLSFEACAEVAAVLAGCIDIEIDISIEVIIWEWFTGCPLPGAPSGGSSSVPSLPSPTISVPGGPISSGAGATTTSSCMSGTTPPATPIPSGSYPVSSGPSPSGPYPSGPSPSGPYPSGPFPSGPYPSGPSPSGPYPSGPSPSGPYPSGPSPSGSGPGISSSPCESSMPAPTPSGSSPVVSVPPGMTSPPAVPSSCAGCAGYTETFWATQTCWSTTTVYARA